MDASQPSPFQVGLKIWITAPSTPRSLFGVGDMRLLQSLVDTNNLTKSAQELGYSYKYAWNKLRELSKKSGLDVVETHRGGYGGGGEMRITPWGQYLIQIFSEINTRMQVFKQDINTYLVENPFTDPKSPSE